jgi:hypothetical protein
MKTTLWNIVQVIALTAALTNVAKAAIYGDFFGVNISLPGRPITIATPQPVRAIQQLPGEIQRLPYTDNSSPLRTPGKRSRHIGCGKLIKTQELCKSAGKRK